MNQGDCPRVYAFVNPALTRRLPGAYPALTRRLPGAYPSVAFSTFLLCLPRFARGNWLDDALPRVAAVIADVEPQPRGVLVPVQAPDGVLQTPLAVHLFIPWQGIFNSGCPPRLPQSGHQRLPEAKPASQEFPSPSGAAIRRHFSLS